MPIEDLLQKLTNAVERNNELLEESNAGRAALVKKADAVAEKSTTSKSKPAEKEAPKKAEKSAPAKKSKGPTADEVYNAFGDYLETEDKKELTKRKAQVAAIKEELGVKKIAEVAEEDRAKALKWLAAFEAGEKVNFNEDQDVDSDDDDDDEDDAPKKSKSKSKAKASDDDDDDSDDDEDDDI